MGFNCSDLIPLFDRNEVYDKAIDIIDHIANANQVSIRMGLFPFRVFSIYSQYIISNQTNLDLNIYVKKNLIGGCH